MNYFNYRLPHDPYKKRNPFDELCFCLNAALETLMLFG